MTVREQIRQEVIEAHQSGVDSVEVPHKYQRYTMSDYEEATDRIIALVEQDVARRLLSEEAVMEVRSIVQNLLRMSGTWPTRGIAEADADVERAVAALVGARIAAAGLTTGGEGNE